MIGPFVAQTSLIIRSSASPKDVLYLKVTKTCDMVNYQANPSLSAEAGSMADHFSRHHIDRSGIGSLDDQMRQLHDAEHKRSFVLFSSLSLLWFTPT